MPEYSVRYVLYLAYCDSISFQNVCLNPFSDVYTMRLFTCVYKGLSLWVPKCIFWKNVELGGLLHCTYVYKSHSVKLFILRIKIK